MVGCLARRVELTHTPTLAGAPFFFAGVVVCFSLFPGATWFVCDGVCVWVGGCVGEGSA